MKIDIIGDDIYLNNEEFAKIGRHVHPRVRRDGYEFLTKGVDDLSQKVWENIGIDSDLEKVEDELSGLKYNCKEIYEDLREVRSNIKEKCRDVLDMKELSKEEVLEKIEEIREAADEINNLLNYYDFDTVG